MVKIQKFLLSFIKKIPNVFIFNVYFKKYISGGFTCVTASSLLGVILGAIFLYFRMRSFKWVPDKKSVRNFLHKFTKFDSKFVISLGYTLVHETVE